MSPCCDVCGAPATNSANDHREIEPIKGRDGRLWANWEIIGETKFGCDKHPAQSIIYGESAGKVISMEAMNRVYLEIATGIRLPLSIEGKDDRHESSKDLVA